MAKHRAPAGTPSAETVISIIRPGMRLVGDCETMGTVRIEGEVEGSVRAGRAVVVAEEGIVHGDIITRQAVISGSVNGTIIIEDLLKLQATCRIEGGVRAGRIQLEEGAELHGTIAVGTKPARERNAPFAGPGKGSIEGDAGPDAPLATPVMRA